MADCAYHMETLRKARALERKAEAMKRLQESAFGQTSDNGANSGDQRQAPLVFAEPGQYAATRDYSKYPPSQSPRRKFDRRPKDTTRRAPTPESLKNIPRDQVYSILHPANFTPSHRINHRRCRAENEGDDHVMPLLHPPEYNFRVPIHDLPPRKPHFKV